jgi:hypothetical protein
MTDAIRIVLCTTFLVVLFSQCDLKKKEGTQSMTNSLTSFEGDYEYFAGPDINGYLYYKLSLHQVGKKINGNLFSGVYLSQSEQGSYSIPAATVNTIVTGKLSGPAEVLLALLANRDSSRMNDTYAYPDPSQLFNQSTNGDPVQFIYKKDSDVVWITPLGDTLVFDRVKSGNK